MSGDETINMILTGAITIKDIYNLPRWITPFLEGSYFSKITTSLGFKTRHSSCKLILRNDSMDYDEDEYKYYPEASYDIPIDRTKDFLANIKNNTRRSIKPLNWITDSSIVLRLKNECPNVKFVMTNKYYIPYGYRDHDDLQVYIPIIECLGTWQDPMTPDFPEYEQYSTSVFKTCDNKLIRATHGLVYGEISEEKFNEIKCGK